MLFIDFSKVHGDLEIGSVFDDKGRPSP